MNTELALIVRRAQRRLLVKRAGPVLFLPWSPEGMEYDRLNRRIARLILER